MSKRFTRNFTALPEHIDELGHVNNAVWVEWVQAIATAHWSDTALPDHQAQYFWVVVRHEIDYRGNIAAGEYARGETWIEGVPQGAKSVRRVDFYDEQDKLLVSAATTWAMLERNSGRLVRVRPEVIGPFQ